MSFLTSCSCNSSPGLKARHEVHGLMLTSRDAEEHSHKFTYIKLKLTTTKERSLGTLFIILVLIALFAFVSRWSLGTKNEALFVSRAKTLPVKRGEKRSMGTRIPLFSIDLP